MQVLPLPSKRCLPAPGGGPTSSEPVPKAWFCVAEPCQPVHVPTADAQIWEQK